MNLKTAAILFTAILLLLVSGCASFIGGGTYTMRFFVNETSEILDGDIMNNGNLIGHTENGTFRAEVEQLRPGIITLNGTYAGEPFELDFEFPAGSFNYSRIDFVAGKPEIEAAIFNASRLDIPKIERTVFDLVNGERMAAGIAPLKWNDRVGAVARDYAMTLSVEGFHHKDIEGKNAGDRLKSGKIFYTVAAENLYVVSGLNASVNVSEVAVKGWMSSPGHRSPILDRDGLFSDTGVGVFCERKTCYSVMVFAGLEQNKDIRLNPGYLTFGYLYDPAYPFDFDVPVDIKVTSDQNINIYLVPDRAQYDNIVNGKGYDAISESRQVKDFSQSLIARKGQGITIELPRSSSAADVNIHIRYS